MAMMHASRVFRADGDWVRGGLKKSILPLFAGGYYGSDLNRNVLAIIVACYVRPLEQRIVGLMWQL